MAFITQDQKKLVAAQVKPILAKAGLKGTLSILHHSKLVLTISAGKIDFLGFYNSAVSRRDPSLPPVSYINVNLSAARWAFPEEVYDVLLELSVAMKSAGWYDNSDIMTDFFDVAYYIDIRIGTWEKPYRFTGENP